MWKIRKKWCQWWAACCCKNPSISSAAHVLCQIDFLHKRLWHFWKGYSVCGPRRTMLLWILKVFPYSHLSIVVECGLISFWLKFLTAVIIPECLPLSPSPSLPRWAKWLRCGDREWFLSAAVQMQGQLAEAYAHLRLAKNTFRVGQSACDLSTGW